MQAVGACIHVELVYGKIAIRTADHIPGSMRYARCIWSWRWKWCFRNTWFQLGSKFLEGSIIPARHADLFLVQASFLPGLLCNRCIVYGCTFMYVDVSCTIANLNISSKSTTAGKRKEIKTVKGKVSRTLWCLSVESFFPFLRQHGPCSPCCKEVRWRLHYPVRHFHALTGVTMTTICQS